MSDRSKWRSAKLTNCRKLTLKVLQEKGTDQSRKMSYDPVREERGQVTTTPLAPLRSSKPPTWPADYALCINGQILGIVEARKFTLGPQSVLTQAERCTTAFETFKLLREEGFQPFWFEREMLNPRKPGERSQNYFFLTPAHLRVLGEGQLLPIAGFWLAFPLFGLRLAVVWLTAPRHRRLDGEPPRPRRKRHKYRLVVVSNEDASDHNGLCCLHTGDHKWQREDRRCAALRALSALTLTTGSIRR